jgi:tRNA-guanine family transglycosylase
MNALLTLVTIIMQKIQWTEHIGGLNAASRLIKNYSQVYDYKQTLFPIVQGSVYNDLRRASAYFIAEQDAPGNCHWRAVGR